MPPEQMKYVKPIVLATTCHLLQDNPKNSASKASSLIKSSKPENFMENYWFPTPDVPGEPQKHTPTQQRILKGFQNLRELEKTQPPG